MKRRINRLNSVNEIEEDAPKGRVAKRSDPIRNSFVP